MTPDRVAEIRALVEAATPGPWTVKGMPEYDPTEILTEVILCGDANDPYLATVAQVNVHASVPLWAEDAALIAAAPSVITELLDHVAALEADLAIQRERGDGFSEMVREDCAERDVALARVAELTAVLGDALAGKPNKKKARALLAADNQEGSK